MIALSVNLNKIALIRNSRDGDNPDLLAHARMALEAGADGITVHPRPDQRHIRAGDCHAIGRMLAAEFPRAEFNIEGNPFAGPRASERSGVDDYPGFMPLARAARPAQCTLVPDAASQLTSDHGFDLRADGERLEPLLGRLRGLGIRVSLFMEPAPGQIELAARIGAQRIELYTGPYAEAARRGEGLEAVWRQYREAAALATGLGLGVNAGHDLDLDNLPRLARLPGLLEVSIGHALTVDAIGMGFANAIAAYRRALDGRVARQAAPAARAASEDARTAG